jgi:uncharacterized membrane protein
MMAPDGAFDETYQWLLTVHILAAVAWVGGGG